MHVGLINLKRGGGLEVDGSSSGWSLRVAEVDVTAYGTAGARLVGNGIGGFASRRLLGDAGEGAQQDDEEPLMLKSHGRDVLAASITLPGPRPRCRTQTLSA